MAPKTNAVRARRETAKSSTRLRNDADLIDRLVADWHGERPDLDPGPMEVVGRVLRLGRQLDARVNEVLKPHGLLYSEFDALATLLRSGAPYELTPTELQEAVVLTSGAMTALLNRLQKQGLISRRRCNEDGRSLTAKLTAKGVKLANKLIGLRFEEAAEAASGLSQREQAEAAKVLRKLGAWLDKCE
ncbi:MAG: MarR family transcriptional regulator [Pseudomonadota bacterium]